MTRLHIYFGDDLNWLPLQSEDIFFVSSSRLCDILKDKGERAYLCKPSTWGYTEKYHINEISKDFLLQFDTKLECLFNSIYVKVLIPALNVLYLIDDITRENKVDEIVLYGGSDMPFITLNEAEGEGHPRFYHREWMMNYLIYHTFGEKLSVVWKKREKKWRIQLILWFREFFFRCWYKLSLVKYGLISGIKNSDNYEIVKENERYNLYMCPLKLQYRHLKRLAGATTVKSYFISTDEGEGVFHLPHLGIGQVYRELKDARIKVHDTQLHIDSLNATLRLGKGLMESLKLEYLKYKVEKRKHLLLNEKTHLIENAARIVNNKTIGADAYLDADLSEMFNKDYLTFQYVAMDLFDCPCHKVWKQLYLYSPMQKDFFRSKGFDAFVYQEPKLKKTQRNATEKKISLFLQPDSFDEYSLRASVILASLVSRNNKYHLFIKPHYRQTNVAEIKAALDADNTVNALSYTILGNDDSVSSILSYSDICVGFNSSVLTESINAEIPTVSIIADRYIKDYLESNEILSKFCWQIDGFNEVSDILDKSDIIINHFNMLQKEKVSGLELRDILE